MSESITNRPLLSSAELQAEFLIDLMAHLNDFPFDPAAISNLRLALLNSTVSPEHAHDVITWWVAHSTECATVADIQRIAAISRERFAKRLAVCATCKGARFVHSGFVERNGDTYPISKPCPVCGSKEESK
jgi:hypothetical protein